MLKIDFTRNGLARPHFSMANACHILGYHPRVQSPMGKSLHSSRQFSAIPGIEIRRTGHICLISKNFSVSKCLPLISYIENRLTLGLMNWMGSMRDQILKHDRTSLQVLSENIAAIVEKEYNEKLNKYITTLANDLSATYKRSINAKEANLDLSVLEQMDLVRAKFIRNFQSNL